MAIFLLALFVENADYNSDFSFFEDQRNDRFYKLYKLASTATFTATLFLLALGIEVNYDFLRSAKQMTWVRVSPLTSFLHAISAL